MLKNRQTLLFLGDVIMLMVALWLMLAIRFDTTAQSTLIRAQTHVFVALFMLWLIIFFIFDLYNLRRVNPNPRTVGLLVGALGVNTALSVVFFYFFPIAGISPKTNLFIVSVIAFILLVAWRRLFYHLFAKSFQQRIAIIGSSPLSYALAAEIKKHPHLGEIVAIWNDRPSDQLPPLDMVVFEPLESRTLIAFSKNTPAVTISLVEAYEALFGRVPIALMTEETAVRMTTRHSSLGENILTRILEVTTASIILILTFPVVMLGVIAIFLEDGSPVFYSQERVGKNGKDFYIYKLRSMKKGAEKNGAQWAVKNDSRITRVGYIIRALHIDELPQMYNVITGDLALIGPRPERPEIVANLERIIPYYFLRHTIRPGFTGWAQIKYRYARTVLDSQEKFEYDLYYLNNKSPLLDIGIILKTIQIVFTHL